MTDKRQWISMTGLLTTIAVALYMVVQMRAQTGVPPADYSNATVAEVRDAQGQIVLSGKFVPVAEEDDDIERKATLEPVGADTDAAGEAEVEIAKAAPADQEIEFAIRNVQPGAVFTFMIDGREIGTATADRRGRAELEIDVAAAAGAVAR